MTTLEKFAADFNALPKFSKSVMKSITTAVYAEPGFSDVTTEDIIAELNCSPKSLGGAIAKLVECGLVTRDESDVNGEDYVFLHITAYMDPENPEHLTAGDFHAIVSDEQVVETKLEDPIEDAFVTATELKKAISRARNLYVGTANGKGGVVYVKVTRNVMRKLAVDCGGEGKWCFDGLALEMYWN